MARRLIEEIEEPKNLLDLLRSVRGKAPRIFAAVDRLPRMRRNILDTYHHPLMDTENEVRGYLFGSEGLSQALAASSRAVFSEKTRKELEESHLHVQFYGLTGHVIIWSNPKYPLLTFSLNRSFRFTGFHEDFGKFKFDNDFLESDSKEARVFRAMLGKMPCKCSSKPPRNSN